MNGFHSDIGRLSLNDEALPTQVGGVDGEEHGEENDMDFDSDVDDSADRHAYGLYQQLPVSPGEPDLSSEPQTAEEYLQRVRCGSFPWPVCASNVSPISNVAHHDGAGMKPPSCQIQ